MRTYLLTTGVLFALLAVLHLWRVVAESASLGKDPWFLIITALAAAMSVWAFRLLRLTRAPHKP
jgi:hypothetical protein